jgi:hypothetical protein
VLSTQSVKALSLAYVQGQHAETSRPCSVVNLSIAPEIHPSVSFGNSSTGLHPVSHPHFMRWPMLVLFAKNT